MDESHEQLGTPNGVQTGAPNGYLSSNADHANMETAGMGNNHQSIIRESHPDMDRSAPSKHHVG